MVYDEMFDAQRNTMRTNFLFEVGEKREKRQFETCPFCGMVTVRKINGKFVRHERGMCFVPYRLYHALEKLGAASVKEQAKKNLCPQSGKGVN